MALKGLVDNLVQTGAFTQVVNNPLAQFGTTQSPYLFANLLPEKEVPTNEYTEEGIRYRSIIANAGTRYSPSQKKGGAIVGSFLVRLGNSDIAAELTSSDYDALIRLQERFTGQQGVVDPLNARPTMEMTAQMVNWTDMAVTQPLMSHNELQRSQALCSAQITLLGDNNYREVVNLPNPTGARVTAGGTWSSNSYDPIADIQARRNYLARKGFQLTGIYTSTDVLTILANNAKVQARAGFISLASGTVTGLASYVDRQGINSILSRDGLPPITLYDKTYLTNMGYGFYLPRDGMLFVCATGRDQTVGRGDLEPVIVSNTLGYMAIGRASGQNAPGRVVKMETVENKKPPRIEAEGWQTSLAVVTDPEAVSYISGIA